MAESTLTFTRAYKIGDRVKIVEITGEVLEKSMMVTKVKTIKNEEVTIGYDSPWRTIHQLLINAALSSEGLLADPLPFVPQTSLDDFYISYQINAYTKEPARIAEIYSRLHQNIQDRFNEAGMEIMSPHYKAMRDGNTIAIPEEYRKKEG
jgi:small-conductance mechanosensitive channel